MTGHRRLIETYRTAWTESGSGQWFLVAGFIFATRVLAFSVAFPLYAKEKGFSSSQIGVLLAAVAISLFLFGAPIALLGTRGNSRRTLIFGPIIAASGVLLILASPGSAMAPALLGCLLAGMASNVYWILGDPFLAAVVPARSRPHVYALKFSLLTAGFAVGGLLGGWIPAVAESAGLPELRAYAAALVLVMTLDLMQVACFRRLPPAHSQEDHSEVQARGEQPLFRGKALWLVFLVLLVPDMGMATAYSAIRPYLSLFFDEKFGMSAGSTGTAIGIMQLSGGIGALLIPSLANRLGPTIAISALRIIGGTMILISLGMAALPVVLALFFVHFTIIDGTGATYVNEVINRLPVIQRTTYSAVAAGGWSIFSAIAASLSGLLQDVTGGFGAAFGVGVIAYFISATWLLIVFPRLPPLFLRKPETIAEAHVAAGMPSS